MTRTPATVAGLECHVPPAIRVIASISPRCPKATEAFSIGRAGVDFMNLRSQLRVLIQECEILHDRMQSHRAEHGC
jgi:hypothetical protein